MYVYIYMHACVNIHICTIYACRHGTYIYICIYICIYIYMYICACMYMSYIYIYVCVSVSFYVLCTAHKAWSDMLIIIMCGNTYTDPMV